MTDRLLSCNELMEAECTNKTLRLNLAVTEFKFPTTLISSANRLRTESQSIKDATVELEINEFQNRQAASRLTLMGAGRRMTARLQQGARQRCQTCVSHELQIVWREEINRSFKRN